MSQAVKHVIRRQVFEGEEIDVLYRDCSNRTEPGPELGYYFPPMNQRTYEDNGILCE